MINIEERCRTIPQEYIASTEADRANLRLELISYMAYNPKEVKTCWEKLRAYDNRITITNSVEDAA